MNEPIERGGDVALFIDWENFKISLAAGHRIPNVSALKEEVSNHGRVVVAKAYADWVARTPELRGASQFINDPPALYAAGIEPVYVPTRLSFGPPSSTGYTRTTRIKNSVDVKMTTDCIETAHSHPNIGTYVLVSGDSDFIHVINTLRTMGKQVVIIGVTWSTSRRLADQVDGLILYDVDIDPETPQEPAPITRAFSRPGVVNGPSGGPELAEVIRAIEDIVREERRAGGTPLLTSIKQRLIRRFANFDERKVGYSGFKKLMARVAQEGEIKLITAGLVDWAIMADEPDPDGATEQPQANGHQATTVLEPSPGFDEFDDEAEDEPDSEPELPVQPPVVQSTTTGTPSDLDVLLDQVIAGLQDLPDGPEDGLNGRRITDLIIMADTLEHREDVDHVAFNFLVGEACQALEQGLEAEDPDIQRRWGQTASRNYVSKMLRSLGNANLFVRAWHSSHDQTSGRTKRRRTFDLDRENPLVQQVLQTQWHAATQDDVQENLGEDESQEVSPDAQPETSETTGESGRPFLSRLFRPRR